MMMMNIIFRVDASINIGSGHVMRCLTLAKQLQKEKNAKVYFISRKLEGNLIDLIRSKEFEVKILPKVDNVFNNLEGYQKWLTVSQQFDVEQTIQILTDLDISIDLLIIDSYAIDIEWENKIRPYVKKIMVIDDLANRKHDCDILLDQNFYLNMEERYNGLVPINCKLFLGPRYVILREEFYEVKKHLRHRNGNIKNIFVFFGGIDITNETMKTLRAIILLKQKDIVVNVVVGKNNPYKESIEKFCRKYDNINYYCQVDNMAELMNEADLAIGAGGTTTWERCFLGLPSLVIAVAENQIEIAKNCDGKILIYLGVNLEIDEKDIYKYIKGIKKDKLVQMINFIKNEGKYYGQTKAIFESCK